MCPLEEINSKRCLTPNSVLCNLTCAYLLDPGDPDFKIFDNNNLSLLLTVMPSKANPRIIYNNIVDPDPSAFT